MVIYFLMRMSIGAFIMSMFSALLLGNHQARARLGKGSVNRAKMESLAVCANRFRVLGVLLLMTAILVMISHVQSGEIG